jgi:hypothetical protein
MSIIFVPKKKTAGKIQRLEGTVLESWGPSWSSFSDSYSCGSYRARPGPREPEPSQTFIPKITKLPEADLNVGILIWV